MTPSPHSVLIARLKALHNDTDNWLCADVAEVDVAIRLMARCHDALTDCLAALTDAPVHPTHDYFAHAPHAEVDAPVQPATSSDWEAAEHTAGTYAGPVQAINVPPATAGETAEREDIDFGTAEEVIAGLDRIIAHNAALPAPAPQGEHAIGSNQARPTPPLGLYHGAHAGACTCPACCPEKWAANQAVQASASPPPLSEPSNEDVSAAHDAFCQSLWAESYARYDALALREKAEAYLLRTSSQHQGRLSPDDLVAFILSLHRPPDAPGEGA